MLVKKELKMILLFAFIVFLAFSTGFMLGDGMNDECEEWLYQGDDPVILKMDSDRRAFFERE